MLNKQNLYLIYSNQFSNWQKRLDLLQDAVKQLALNPILIDANNFDYSAWQSIPANKKDMFYNVTPFNHEIENIFIQKGLTSFFIEPNKLNYLYSSHQFEISLINSGIPTPKTILKGCNNRVLLKKYAEFLGGFPLILKVTGGSQGIGVIKIDTWQGLISTADYLVSEKKHFQLKEYIPNEGTYRVIVVGNSVIGSIFRQNIDKDFRVSGDDGKNFQNIQVAEKFHELCVKAAKAVNYEFIGLDLSLDLKGNPYIFEINYPNNFAPPKVFIENRIALQAIKYLKEKSLRHN